MKKLLFIMIITVFSLSAFAGMIDITQNANYSWFRISLNGYSAFDAEYNEFPDAASPSQDHIWGKFDTDFIGGSIEIRPLIPLLIIHGGYNRGMIKTNNMYIASPDQHLKISGSSNDFNVNVGIRPFNGAKGYMDITAGFCYLGAKKTFTDFIVDPDTIMPGTFGSYEAKMFGPQVTVRGKGIVHTFFGIGASISYSPYFENHSTVTGWTADPKQEFAKGYRYKAEGMIMFKFSLVDITAGMRFEKLYFNSSSEVTHDLNLIYSGPFVELGVSL